MIQRILRMNSAESTGRYPNVIDTESLEDDQWPRHGARESGLLWSCMVCVVRFFSGSVSVGCHRRQPSGALSRNLIAV